MSFSTELKLKPFPITFNLNYTATNGEWVITGTDIKKEAFPVVSTRPEDESKISDILVFILKLKRRPAYVTQNIIYPAYLTSGLSLVAFLIPPSSGERVSVTLSILVAFTVFMLIAAQSIPRTSALPVLTGYLAYELVNIVLSVIISMTVVYLHHKKDEEMHWIFTKIILFHHKNINKMKTCRKNKKLNVVCDGGENRKEIDNCAKKVQENNRDQTKMIKDMEENLIAF